MTEDTLVYVLATALLLLIGILMLIGSYRSVIIYRMVRDTPISKIRSVSVGFAEVKGEADTKPENYFEDPYEKEDCLYYKIKVQRHDNDDEGSDWTTIKREKEYCNFKVDDDTGKLKVKPNENTEFSGSEKEERLTVSEEEAPEIIKENDDVGGLLTDKERYRIKLEKIKPQEELIVLGKVKPNDNTEYSKEGHENLCIESDGNKSFFSKITGLPFLISNAESEEKLISNYKRNALLLFVFGIGLLGGGVYLVFNFLL